MSQDLRIFSHAMTAMVLDARHVAAAILGRGGRYTDLPCLGFGGGTLLCAEQWAARISIGEIAVPLLYAQLPGLRTDPRCAEAWHSGIFRGLTTLPVTWHC